MSALIHPTALVSEKSRLGKNTTVGPFALIEDDVETGPDCRIASHAILRQGTKLGAGVQVDSFAVIAGNPQDFSFDAKTITGVRVGDRTVIRESVTIHRSTTPGEPTTVGPDCLIMANAHIAHDCHLDHHVIVANGALLAGHVSVGAHSFLSGNTVFHQFTRIGESVMVGGGARIGYDVPHFVIAVERNEVHAINVIGLRRRGFSSEVVKDLKSVYRAVYVIPGGPKKNAARANEQKLAQTPEGQRFLDFFLSASRGAFVRPPANKTSEG